MSFYVDLFIYNRTLAFPEQCVLLSQLLRLGPFSFSAHPVSTHFPSAFHMHYSLAPRLSAHCLQAEADSGNYPSTFLLPEQFSCEPLMSPVLEMKEAWKDALGVWDQHEVGVCFSRDLDVVQVFFIFHAFPPPSISVLSAMCERACISSPYLVFCLWSCLYWPFSFCCLLLSFFISFFRL